MKEQEGKEVRYISVIICHQILADVKKSNMKTETKMRISMMIGFLDGINEVRYVQNGKYI